jgi:hypothetical protein
MMPPPIKPTARQRWEACQDHIWKARGLARVVQEAAATDHVHRVASSAGRAERSACGLVPSPQSS